MAGIWEDVKGRRIFRTATLYTAISWGTIQVADILSPLLQFPDWVLSTMVIVAFIGLPIALVVSWLLDIKNEKKQLSTSINSKPITKTSFASRLVEFVIILLFSGVAAALYSNIHYTNNQFHETNRLLNDSSIELSSIQSLTQNSGNQKTIAVLPFSSFGDSKQDEYFADGLSEELLNVLAKHKSLRVAARTSSFQYKNKKLNIKTIGKELRVQYILEGSVRRSGDNIRVTAQLFDAEQDVPIFSSTWNKDLSNIFKVQDEIALSVLETLEVKLLGKVNTNDSNGTKSIAALTEYSKGLGALRQRSKKGFEQAKNFFDSAINLDPSYAEAYALMAETYLLESSYDNKIEPSDVQVIANRYLDKALEFNGELAIAHSVKGLLYWQRSNTDDNSESELENAKSHLNHAIQLNPSNAEAYMWYGSILINEGNFLDGSKLHKRAYEIDHQSAVVGFNRAEDLIRQGDYNGAMVVFNKIVRNNPNYDNAYLIAGSVSLLTGDLSQAYEHFNKAKSLGSDEWRWRINVNQVYMAIGEFKRAQENLDYLLSNQSKGSDSSLVTNFLQPELWLASDKTNQLKRWISTFEKESEHWYERLWRGYLQLDNQNWEKAIDEFEKAKKLIASNKAKYDENIQIRLNLLLSKAWSEKGDSLRKENYLNMAQQKIDYLVNKQKINPLRFRYYQAEIENLSGNQLKALNLLRQAIKEGFVEIWNIKTDPIFDNLRNDPTYLALILGLETKLEKSKNKIFPLNKVAIN